MIHPTEVQLLRIEADGELVFHVYTARRASRPERRAELALRVLLPLLRPRLRREIDVLVHELAVVERDELAVRVGAPPWSSRDLERFFAAPPTRPSLVDGRSDAR